MRELQRVESFCDVVTGNGFFGLFFRDCVCFAGDEGDKLDAAFNEEISGVFCEGCAILLGLEDFGYNLLDCGCEFIS